MKEKHAPLIIMKSFYICKMPTTFYALVLHLLFTISWLLL